jgi:hypothetical protein
MVTHIARNERLEKKRERNNEIVALVEGGTPKGVVARQYGISYVRVDQIIRRHAWLIKRDEQLDKGYFFGQHSRFMIRRIHGWFYIHDASLVTDSDIKNGRGSPIIYRAKSEYSVMKYCYKLDPYEFKYASNVDYDEAQSD